MIAAGEMRDRIVLQSKSVTKNAIGEDVVSWVSLPAIWAKVMPLRGNAFYSANQQQHTIDARFMIRDRAGLTTDMRLIWNGQPYDIAGLIPGTEKYSGTIEIMAVNGVRDGR
jgi:SPP1 family predicted phage head-tail adaptor